MQFPDAEKLFTELLEALRPHVDANTGLVGIHTGGVWLAARLHRELGLQKPLGSIDVSFYRDDYGSKGLHAQPKRSEIPFEVDQTHILMVDDVLYTGRTTRAALNELFDYGRPARVDLAVLVDRGGRELPIAPRFCALTLTEELPPAQLLQLERGSGGQLKLSLLDA